LEPQRSILKLMLLTPQDELHLARALSLARDAAAFASPNPTVGCVIALSANVLGEGAHRYDALDHAEIVALKQAATALKVTNAALKGTEAALKTTEAALKGTGFSPSVTIAKAAGALAPEGLHGATTYVTLEPCSHHGRTGPCADALIAAGIARCVVATVDPNPLVSGQGIARLRAAGIEVVLADGKLALEARRLNDAFAHQIQRQRPFVTLKAALSVDGKLAPPPATRTTAAPHWITGTAARADAQLLRHTADAIVTGIGTVLADDPLLTDRTGKARRRPLLRVVLDSELKISPDSKLVRSAADDLLIVCSSEAPLTAESALLALGVQLLRLPLHQGRLNLNALLRALAVRHITSVLVEAGSAVNGSFLRAGLVDKLVLYFAERELGLDAVDFAAGFASPYELQQQLTSVTQEAFANASTEDVRISGYLHDPWDGVAELVS
jgi:diaminohydroxyphosphoribosylaminopyrimidine deaminase/5-amino-6-(5-phosphoribosylamino)uracil reductase